MRFGAEPVFTLCELQGIEVIIIHRGEQPSFKEEPARDGWEIITVFPARPYGARSRRHRRGRDAPADEDVADAARPWSPRP